MVLELDNLKGKVFDVYEVAKLLGINADSVRLRIRKGYLPARKVPGDRAYAIHGDDLAAYLSGELYRPPGQPKKRGKGKAKGTPTGRAKEPDSAPIGCRWPAVTPDGVPERLREWVESTGKTVRELAQEVGIERSSFQHILAGNRSLSHENAGRLHRVHGDALLEFLLGDGPLPKDAAE